VVNTFVANRENAAATPKAPAFPGGTGEAGKSLRSAGLHLTAVDAVGATLATLTVNEPDADGLFAGAGLINRW